MTRPILSEGDVTAILLALMFVLFVGVIAYALSKAGDDYR